MKSLIAAVVLLAACSSGPDPQPTPIGGGIVQTWPGVESLYHVQDGSVVCDGAIWTQATPNAAAPTEVLCNWRDVSYQGVERCWVMVVFKRAAATDQWPEPTVFPAPAGLQCP